MGVLLLLPILIFVFLIMFLFAISKFSVKIGQKKYANMFGGAILLMIIWSFVGIAIIGYNLLYLVVIMLLKILAIYGATMLFVKGACISEKHTYGYILLFILSLIFNIYLALYPNVIYGTGGDILIVLNKIVNILTYAYSVYISYYLMKRFGYDSIVAFIMAFFFFLTFPYLVLIDKMKRYQPCDGRIEEKINEEL